MTERDVAGGGLLWRLRNWWRGMQLACSHPPDEIYRDEDGEWHCDVCEAAEERIRKLTPRAGAPK